MPTQNNSSSSANAISISMERTLLTEGWSLTSTAPNAIQTPSQLDGNIVWQTATVPSSLAANVQSNLNLDELDWWYQCQFTIPDIQSREGKTYLQFDGLASIAEVWLNNHKILDSQNMFIAHHVEISNHMDQNNHLVIVFRSLQNALCSRKPRPQWKTNLVESQQLRWFRTSLLGYIPGWAHSPKVIGPWRDIHLLLPQHDYQLEQFRLSTQRDKQFGIVELTATIESSCLKDIDQITLEIDGQTHPVEITSDGNNATLDCHIEIQDPPLWWPHTHGEPKLLDYRLNLISNNETLCLKYGKIGFKHIALENTDQVGFIVNGQNIFCRGACWSHSDIESMQSSNENLEKSLQLAKEAGINMLRIGGTMVYESDLFYELCDQLGIMVWQDFMFANMDYPIDDPEFENNVRSEITFQLQRLHTHVCISNYCGNSEVQQQAAMFGMDHTVWQSKLFDQLLPEACQLQHPSVPYIPSSPTQGALPFHIESGISHYFGVGAYKRPLNDPSLHKVKFTSECLGFSNIPCQKSRIEHFGHASPPVHSPQWKQGVPRDNAAGWDFEDIRDHYLASLFKLDPIELRYSDNERYLALSEIVSGEVMQSVYASWRSMKSSCQGGLVWFYQDLFPGAGWGIIDHMKHPKAVYYYLKRIWAKQIIALNDQQLDGLSIDIINEHCQPLTGSIELTLLRNGQTEIAKNSQTIELDAHSQTSLSADALMGRFYDLSYAYRFGPCQYDVVVASLKDQDHRIISSYCYFTNGMNLKQKQDIAIQTELTQRGDHLVLNIESDCFLQALQIDIKDHIPEDNYFHLPPNHTKTVLLKKIADSGKSIRGTLKPLNTIDIARIRL